MELEALGLKNVFTFQEKGIKETLILYDITKTAQRIFGDIIVRAGIEFSYVTLGLLQQENNERYIKYLQEHHSSLSKDIDTPSTRLDFDSDRVVLFFSNGRIVTVDASECGWLEAVKEEDKQFQW